MWLNCEGVLLQGNWNLCKICWQDNLSQRIAGTWSNVETIILSESEGREVRSITDVSHVTTLHDISS